MNDESRIAGLFIAIGMLVLIFCQPLALLGSTAFAAQSDDDTAGITPLHGEQPEETAREMRELALSMQGSPGVKDVKLALVSPDQSLDDEGEPDASKRIRNSVLINASISPVDQVSRLEWKWLPNTLEGPENDNVSISEYGDGFFDVPVPQVTGPVWGTLWIKATDLENDVTWAYWNFYIDNYTVFMTLTSPEEGKTYQSGTPVTVEFEPEPLGVLYKWDADIYTAGSSPLVTPLPTGETTHTLTVKSEHPVTGGWREMSWSFIADNTPAPVSITSPANASTVKSRTDVIWTNGSDLAEVYFSWDGGDNQSEPDVIPDGVGTHTLDIVSVDHAGNTARYYYEFHATIAIIVEYPVIKPEPIVGQPITNPSNASSFGYGLITPDTVPVITFTDTPANTSYNWWLNITDPGTNSTTLDPSPSVEGEVKLLEIFANGSDSIWDHVAMHLTTDGTPPAVFQTSHVNESQLIGNTSVAITFDEPLLYLYYAWDGGDNGTDDLLPDSIGRHEVDVWASDYAENWYHEKYVYYTRYTVALNDTDGINDGDMINPGTLINITVTPDPVAVYYSWDNGPAVTTVPGAPSTSAVHWLNVTCVDGESNSYTTIYSFLVVLLVEVLSPVVGTPVKSGTAVTLSFSDTPNTVLYTWDSGTQSFSLKPVPEGDGDHVLKVEVENNDTVGGRRWFVYSFTFITDNTPPSITGTSHENGTAVNSLTELIFYTGNENVTIAKYSWNGGTYQDAMIGNKNVTLPAPVSEGLHNLTLNVTDQLGNRASFNYNYTVDDTPLEITLVSPVNGSAVLSGTAVNVTFDEQPIEARYNWDNGTDQSKAGNIPWGNGTHVLLVNASDGLNWASKRFVFIAIDPLVKITVLAPSDGHRNTSANLEAMFSVEYSETTANIWYSWNSSELETEFNAHRDDGMYNFTIIAQELSGANRTHSMTLVIDNSAPVIVATSPDILTWPDIGYPSVDLKNDKKLTFYLDEMTMTANFKWNGTGEFVDALNEIGPANEVVLNLPNKAGFYFLEIILVDDLGNAIEYTFEFNVKHTQTGLDVGVIFLGVIAVTLLAIGSAGVIIWRIGMRKGS